MRRLSLVLLVAGAVTAGVVVVRARGCTWGTFAYEIFPEERGVAPDIGVLRDGETFRVTHGNVSSTASLSPDGERIVFGHGRSSDEEEIPGLALYVADLDGSDEELLTRRTGTPSWSPAGNEILVVRGDIRVVDVETKEERLVYRLPPPQGYDPDYIGGAAWSGNGERIAFFVGKSAREQSPEPVYFTELWVVGADGSNPHRLKRLEDEGLSDLAWSPDGETFAWTGIQTLVLMDAEELEPWIAEPNARRPHWSRDGEQLAYVIGDEGRYDFRIVVGDADGSDAVSVPGSPREDQDLRLEDWASC